MSLESNWKLQQDCCPCVAGKDSDRGKPARSKEKQARQSSEKKPKQEMPRDSNSTARSKNRTLPAPARKRIALAMKDRWEAARKASQSNNGAAAASSSVTGKRLQKPWRLNPAKIARAVVFQAIVAQQGSDRGGATAKARSGDEFRLIDQFGLIAGGLSAPR